MIDRRLTLVVTVALTLLAAPLAAEAQPAGKVFRIGVLSPSPSTGAGFPELLRQSLRELGYVEG